MQCPGLRVDYSLWRGGASYAMIEEQIYEKFLIQRLNNQYSIIKYRRP